MNKEILKIFFAVSIVLLSVLFVNFAIAATPVPPTGMTMISNETKNTTGSSGSVVNVSGGYLSTINLSSIQQNPRWKGIVGWLNGKFALDDQTGATLFDWSTIVTGGKVYATRNSSTITWSQIKCANRTILETENRNLNQTRSDDNITSTFSDTTHRSFNVGSVPVSTNTCPTLNTYVNNVTQQGEFEEVALFDGLNDTISGNLVYAGLLNQTKVGFDGHTYDFQMIVPEVGLATWTSSMAYYLYVEIN